MRNLADLYADSSMPASTRYINQYNAFDYALNWGITGVKVLQRKAV
jgi:hypothetical protein